MRIHGGLYYTTLFNVAVGSVVQHWFSLTEEVKYATNDGLGMAVGRSMGIFYADDSLIGSQDPEWLQGAINVLIGILHRVSLMPNIVNSNTMTCQPVDICTGMSEENFSQRSTGEGTN